MNKYDDIINMPHHVSKIRKPLSIENRSAQFAPFSCLTGYDKRIREVSREKVEKKELDDEVKLIINEKLWLIKNDIKLKPKVTISYFIKDMNKKNRGEYITITSNVKTVDEVYKRIILIDNTVISFDNIIDIKI